MTKKQLAITTAILLAVSAIAVGIELCCGWVSDSLDRGFLRWDKRGVYILGFYLVAKLIQAAIAKKRISPLTGILLGVAAIVTGIELWCWWGSSRDTGMTAMLVGSFSQYILGFYLGAKMIQAAILSMTKKQISGATAIILLVSVIVVGIELWWWWIGDVRFRGVLIFGVGQWGLLILGIYLVGKLIQATILSTNAEENTKQKLVDRVGPAMLWFTIAGSIALAIYKL